MGLYCRKEEGEFDLVSKVGVPYSRHSNQSPPCNAFHTFRFCSVEFTQEPRYLKSSNAFSAVPTAVVRGWCSGGMVMTSVFLAFSRRPTFVHSSATLVGSSCACFTLSESKLMSSALSRSLRANAGCHLHLFGGSRKPSSCSYPLNASLSAE